MAHSPGEGRQMNSDAHELEVLIRSRVPIVVIESHDENRALSLIRSLETRLGRPLFAWSVTEGLRRLDLQLGAQKVFAEPEAALKHIKALPNAGVFVLRDLHPYLNDAVIVRLLKDIALGYETTPHTLVLLSHALEVPAELRKLVARLRLSMPDRNELTSIVEHVVADWQRRRDAFVDEHARELLISNLAGLSARDAQRLATAAICDDDALTSADLPRTARAKYQLLAEGGALHFEFDPARFRDLAGFRALKHWLQLRHDAFTQEPDSKDRPKGVLLLGVQGCGKSLAAKAAAGTFGVPLLRLDIGAIYDKYYGETEKNLRESLAVAEAMSPCVLWIDELEKGIAAGRSEDGLSRRVLGTLLTWMAEQRSGVFLVATANDIHALPPEIVRKGRFDEIFFVDLPDHDVRRDIFRIHCMARAIPVESIDLDALAAASEGFSGAEIEQAVIAACYSVENERPGTETMLAELKATRPLSVVMAEKIAALRDWARDRTVPAD